MAYEYGVTIKQSKIVKVRICWQEIGDEQEAFSRHINLATAACDQVFRAAYSCGRWEHYDHLEAAETISIYKQFPGGKLFVEYDGGQSIAWLDV